MYLKSRSFLAQNTIKMVYRPLIEHTFFFHDKPLLRHDSLGKKMWLLA